MTSAIPIVDLQEFNLTKAPEDVSDDVKRQLAAQIINAFSTVGFVGLTNYGIPQDKLNMLMKEARNFFNLPENIKQKYSCRPQYGDEIGGWEHIGQEQYGIHKHDPNYFKNQHKKGDISGPRYLYYPAITSQTDVKPNQIRCGEHSDYGSITLLFQDDVGGLQLRSRNGKFVPATPKAGTMYINIGEVLQRWTADKLISTEHRVVIPETPSDREKVRMSVVYFAQPDRDCLIQCLDGSDKYEPITSLELLSRRLKATYPE
ncbi:hypothetical protein NP493_21g00015 [Ridgeia piscesae]|uniref:Fe2OG dioxygenase domain-containing protein n=1 Tax=Ridgeia piscesae TaxID=27915 RepID=A0AAD9UKM6_RIDPI|nr:hypothetical protein NP493_21g00015 [Ridgeia piscesae]